MKSFFSQFSDARPVGALALGLVLLTTGCGFGTLAPASPSVDGATSVAFGGKLNGGPLPVVGATVKLYATGCNTSTVTGAACSVDGYGVGQFLQEATTVANQAAGYDSDSNGYFHFAGGYTCPPKQFAYIVATGGNGGGGVNSAITLVAAVGRCEDLTSSTTVYVSELSTVAAAYALGHFTTTYGTSGAGLVVGIGAPVTNNSQTYVDANSHSAGCVSNSSLYTTTPATCTATVAAGLYHAFLNAANLMPVTYYLSAAPSAIVTPGTTISPPVVPNRLINSIANSISACVNSTGPSSTACTTVLGAGKLNSVTPTNVFQALINIASNPTLAGTSYTPSTFLGAGSAILAYGPALATAPSTDLSIAINYPKGLGGGSGAATPAVNPQGLTYVFSNGLDINDTEYIANDTANGNGVVNIVSFSSNGTLLNQTTNEAASGAQALSPDALGNLYTGDYGATGYGVQKWSYNTSGVVGNTPTTIATTTSVWSLAVDRSNNVWVGLNTASTSGNLFEIPVGTTTATLALSTDAAPTSVATSYLYGVAVDPDQNIWMADYVGAGGGVSVLENTGTVTAPAYKFQVGTGSTTQATAVETSVTNGEGPFGLTFVTNTNTNTNTTSPYIEWTSFYYTGNPPPMAPYVGMAPITPTVSSTGQVTALSPGTLVVTNNTASYLQFAASDGDGTVYGANKNGDDIMVIQNAGSATPSAPFYLAPCFMATSSSTACPASTSFNGLREVNIDGTGSMWIAMGTQGNVLQIIGTAAPTWPLLSLGVLGRP